MIHLSTCPRCARMVRLPENAESAAVVRCPLCCAEYPLGEALALAPPALIVVPPAAQPAMDAAPATPVTGLLTEPFVFHGPTIPAPDEEDDFAIEAIHETAGVQEAPTETPATANTEAAAEAFVEPSATVPADISADIPVDIPAEIPAEIPFEMPADAFIEETEEAEKEAAATESPDEFTFDFTEDAAEAPSVDEKAGEPAELPMAALTAAPVSAVAENHAAENAAAITATPERPKEPPRARPLVKPAPPRRKRAKRGPIRTLLGWALGLCMATVIAYYGVWWIRGEAASLPRFDWVPFLPPEGYGAPKPAIADARAKAAAQNPQPAADTQTAPPAVNSAANSAANPAVNPAVSPAANTAEKADASATEKPVVAQKPVKVPIPEAVADIVPNAEPKELLMPPIGPRPSGEFNFYDLDNSLQAVTDAFLAAGTVNAENYPAFCRLAEVRTYIAAEKLLPAQRKPVQELLDNIAKDPKQIAEIGRLAGDAMKKTKEQLSQGDTAVKPGGHMGGILLAGKVAKISSKNGLYGAVVKLAEVGDNVVVLAAKPFGFVADDDVLIAGGMVAKPAENVAGFQGGAQLIIWQGDVASIPAAPAK